MHFAKACSACSVVVWNHVCARNDPAEGSNQLAEQQPRGWSITIRLATNNMLTLSESEDAAEGFSTHRRQFDAAFAEHGLDFVGLQKARGRHQALRKGTSFFVAASPAMVAGVFGCELWVQRALCSMGARFSIVLLSEPQRLLIKVFSSLGPLWLC